MAEVPDTGSNSEIISDELWLSIFGPMAESGALTTDLTEAELAGDNDDGLYLLYSLKFIKNSYKNSAEGYQYMSEFEPDDITIVADEMILQNQNYNTNIQDLTISHNLIPVKN